MSIFEIEIASIIKSMSIFEMVASIFSVFAIWFYSASEAKLTNKRGKFKISIV